MTLRSLQSVVALTLIALPGLLMAQAQASSSEEVRLEKLMADSAQWYVPRTTVSLGFRVLSNGGKVHFGNLGTVAFDQEVAALSAGVVDRVYDNGAVRTDAARLNEKDADGNVITTPGTRYPVLGTATVNVLDADGNQVLNADGTNQTQTIQIQVGDMLAYTPGVTRNWAYGAASQVTADGTHIGMSTYSATSEGASAMKENGMSAGVEFQYVRTLSKPNSRLQWGMLAGLTLNGINSKSSGTITATLHTRTDYYSLAGATAPTAPYFAPSFIDFLDGEGNLIQTSGVETTVPIAEAPDSHTETTTVGGATIDGNWQVKGAYYMIRLGPSFRTQLTNRLGVNASLGVAGAYVGTTYSVRELLHVPDEPDVFIGATVGANGDGYESTTMNKFLTGYYADFNLEWAANERTGLFTGFTAQKFDGYDQTVGSRTARIDLGSSVGLRGGVSIRF